MPIQRLSALAGACCVLLLTASTSIAQPAICTRLSDPLAPQPAADPSSRANPWGSSSVEASTTQVYYPACWKTSDCRELSEFREILNAYMVVWMARADRDVEIRFDDETGKCWIAARKGPQGTGAIILPGGTYRVGIDSPETREIEMRIRLAGDATPYGPLSTAYDIIGARYIGPQLEDINTLTKLLNTPTSAIDPAELAKPLPFAETVTIRGVDAGTHSIPGSAIERPLSPGRSVHAALSQVPGITVTEATGTGGQWTVAGSPRRLTTRFSVDGVSANVGIALGSPGIGEGSSESTPAAATTGSTQTLVQAAAVDEVTVRAAGVEATDARSSGAQVAITTRSGTSKLSVMAATRLMLSPAAELTPSFLGSYRPPESAGTGLSAGAPLIPGRALVFGAVEYEHQNRPYNAELTLTPEHISLRQKQEALYAAAPRTPVYDIFGRFLYESVGDYPKVFEKALGISSYLPNFRGDSGAGVTSIETRRKSWLYTYSLRTDLNLSARHRAFLRFNQGRSDGEVYIGRFAALSQNTERTRMYSLTAGTSSTFGNSLVNELRINATNNRGYLDSVPVYGERAEFLPAADRWADSDRWVRFDLLPGASMMEGRSADVTQRQIQVVNTTTYQRGRHQWRIGIDATVATASSTPPTHRYTYSFSNLTQLADGRARQILSERVQPASARFSPVALFADHTVAIGRRVEINVGLRVSRIPPPVSNNDVEPTLLRFAALPVVEELPRGTKLWTPATTLAPRLGIAYQLRPATILRATWGLVYDELSRPGAGAIGGGYPYIQRAVFTPTSLPALATRASELEVPADSRVLAEYFSYAEGLRPSRSAQLTVGIEQSTRALGQFGVTFVATHARDLVYWSSAAAPGPVTINTYSNNARAAYRGIVVEHRRPLRAGLAVSSHYTWSRMRDTESGDTLTPNPPEYLLSPNADLSTSDLDRPHVLRFEASYELPRTLRIFSRWQLAGAAIARSGRPFSVTSAQQLGPSVYDLRADLTTAETWIRDSAAPGGRRLNPDAFVAGTGAGHGTGPRNFLRGSPLRQIDLSLARSVEFPFPYGGQRAVFRVHVTAVNVFNIASYGPPIAKLGVSGFGTPDRSAAQSFGTGTLAGSGLSPLEQDGRGRALQLGLRLGW